MEIVILENPTSDTFYLLYDRVAFGKPDPFILCGKQDLTLDFTDFDFVFSLISENENDIIPSKIQNKFIGQYTRFPIEKNKTIEDEKTFGWIISLYNLFKEGKRIYIYCPDGYNNCGIFGCCLLMMHYKISSDKAIEMYNLLYESMENRKNYVVNPRSKFQTRQIERFEPPLRVIVSGDRDSTIVFEDIIRMALNELPQGSTIIHGACRGVDLTAQEIAKELGLQFEPFPISKEDWRNLGAYAGPKRNKDMLDSGADLVLAFHPDIRYSKGTKDMVLQAYKRGVDCYIHDLNSKKKFNGDFDINIS